MSCGTQLVAHRRTRPASFSVALGLLPGLSGPGWAADGDTGHPQPLSTAHGPVLIPARAVV